MDGPYPYLWTTDGPGPVFSYVLIRNLSVVFIKTVYGTVDEVF